MEEFNKGEMSSDYNLVVKSFSLVRESSALDTQPLFGELVVDQGYFPMRMTSDDGCDGDNVEDNDEDDDNNVRKKNEYEYDLLDTHYYTGVIKSVGGYDDVVKEKKAIPDEMEEEAWE
ncbi:hypothetical protein R6Q57_016666 [Mikania cordata]